MALVPPQWPGRGDWVLIGMFVAMVVAVLVIAFVSTRQPVLVPVFEVIVVPDVVAPRLA